MEEKKTKTVKTVKKVEAVKKAPVKKTISDKMDILVAEMMDIIKNDRKELNTSSCANINKAIADLGRISKNLKR